MTEIDLHDGTADAFLLDAPGASLVIFTSQTCSACRAAAIRLPGFDLPVQRLCWIDAGRSGGLVSRYEVFHLPALFLVRDGELAGEVAAPLSSPALNQAIEVLLSGRTTTLP